ncbi:hypothetical protein AGMMS49942_06350 [Spirochaetia bacterium]|nr:hypothetical protein AGMMS49942_06350 [Spirochaetia bacterium]
MAWAYAPNSAPQAYGHRVLQFRTAQMDGETVLLTRADFPAAIELTELAIPVLKAVYD